MGDDNGNGICFGLGLVIGLLAGSFLGFWKGAEIQRKAAIRAGAAEYVGDRSTGEVTFTYRPCAEAAK